MRTIYAIPNYECNLNCPHCTLHNKRVEFNEQKFIDTLNSFSDQDNVILFGGEPTLYKDRYFKCFLTNKISSVSTNLLNVDDDILKSFSDISLATSWNRNRFTQQLYLGWLNNLKKLSTYNNLCMVMITMTNDLLENDYFSKFLSVLKDIEQTTAANSILFEHVIGNNDNSYYEKCDDWLCKIHTEWNNTIINMIDINMQNFKHDCANVYTLLPNGDIINSCPQYEKQFILNECLTCKYTNICKPCKLHNKCSFPKKLFNLINVNN